jgi:putative nucleotidyltransferase with HDIG domain
MQAWGDSIESKHIYGAGHSARVAGYASALARALGFAARDVTWLGMGALLHDIGLSGVPAEILNKPGKLSGDEYETLKRHTIIGDELVSETPFPWDIRPIIRNHHEHWNGTGYPDRLAGEEIPLTARIITVADVFAALTSARSYRGAYTQQEALDVMQREVGSVLDPKLFELFRNSLLQSGDDHG